MKKITLLLTCVFIIAWSTNSKAQCVYESDMEEPIELYSRHGGWGPVHGGDDHSDLGHWLGWVSSGMDIVLADGDDGLAWGWEDIEPIDGERSLKADILQIGSATEQAVSALTIFPLIDYTQDHVLYFSTRVEGEWPIKVYLLDSYRADNAALLLWEQEITVPDGDSRLRLEIPAATLQEKLTELAAEIPDNFAFHGTRIEILVGTREGKFVMDNLCLMLAADDDNTNTHEPAVMKMRVFPNPAASVLYLENIENVSSVEILNLVGQIVKSVDVNSNARAQIAVDDLKTGLYIVRTKSNERVINVSKFVKE